MKKHCSNYLVKFLAVFGLWLVFLSGSCTRPNLPAPSPAVYHWKQKFNVSEAEWQLLDSLNCSKIYLRFFDLDKENESGPVIPFSVMEARWPQDRKLEIIPVVFITNRSFQETGAEQVEQIAENLFDKVVRMLEELPPEIKIKEWQLDCDWTQSTREAFFQLAAIIRDKLKKEGLELSTTIRLHQIKFADKTGVPPADRGMLMFYNMDNVRDSSTQNSILDLDVAGQYMQGFSDYPLPLDIALPVFSWAVWQRNTKTLGLLYPFDPSSLQDSSRVEQLSASRYKLLKSTYLDGRFLYEDDQLRLEEVHPDLLLQAMDMLGENLPPESRTLSFYALDQSMLKSFSNESLRQILHRWKKID
ncbi:MAG: hypothetical protein GYB31_15980 [Bacteroidetes bacterium]|nr:hypothetical protein [Bacteroidota bacterium]